MNSENTLTFQYWPADTYPRMEVNFNFVKDMNIWDYKEFCRRFAVVMGFPEGDIQEAF